MRRKHRPTDAGYKNDYVTSARLIARWNICQQITKMFHRSQMTDDELVAMLQAMILQEKQERANKKI